MWHQVCIVKYGLLRSLFCVVPMLFYEILRSESVPVNQKTTHFEGGHFQFLSFFWKKISKMILFESAQTKNIKTFENYSLIKCHDHEKTIYNIYSHNISTFHYWVEIKFMYLNLWVIFSTPDKFSSWQHNPFDIDWYFSWIWRQSQYNS